MRLQCEFPIRPLDRHSHVKSTESTYMAAMMIHPLKIAGVFCAAALCVSPAAAQPDGRKFTVVNLNASASIQRVWYVRIGTTDSWIEVPLDYPIKPNHRSLFTLAPGDPCLYSVKIRFDDGNEQAFENINVCRGDDVTVS
jgi:hypothetical protein